MGMKTQIVTLTIASLLYISIAITSAQPDFVAGNLLGKVELFVNADGNFSSHGIIKDVGDRAWGLTSGDYNGDGYPDFIVGDYDGQIELFPGSGFASAGIIADVGDKVYGLTSGDYDNDGDIDFVTGDRDGELELFLNNGSGGFSSAGIIADIGMNAWGLASGDYDGNGNCDFVAGNSDGTLKLFKNDGTANFTSTTIADIGAEAYGITCGDYDGDGDCDLLATANDGNVTLFKNNGAANFIECGTVISLGSYRFGLESNDFDADGDIDVLAETANETISLYKNDGTGNFNFDGVVAYPGAQPRGLTSGEFVMPDLAVTQITVPAAVYANMSNVITVTIENAGNEAATFTVAIYANSSVIDTKTISLNAGSSTDISFSWAPAHTGNYSLQAIADTQNAIPEFNETNNAKERDVTVEECAIHPATPLFFYGFVHYNDGSACNGPIVNVTNLNTGAKWHADTISTSNYYQVSTTSWNVSAGSVLNFNVSDNLGNYTEFNHTVTQDEIDNGGFVQNITITVPITGICGDVTDDSIVNMGDVALLLNNVSYPGNPTYALKNEWAGDVTGDNVVNMGDVALLLNNVSYPGNPTYNLNCM